MNRFGAFLIHLGISLVIFAVLAYLVLYVWYPDFFFASDGGWQGMRIIVFVDLVLGPTLTLVVFNRKKPVRELKRDLSIIATIQVVCLAAGTYVVYAERPLALVYVDGRFFSMSADDYAEYDVPVPSLQDMPGKWPKRVMVTLPEEVAAQAEVRRSALQRGVPLRALTERYAPLDGVEVATQGEPLSASALESRESETGDLTSWIRRHGGSVEQYAFFPFGARYGYLILGMAKQDGAILGLLDTEIRLVDKRSQTDREESPAE